MKRFLSPALAVLALFVFAMPALAGIHKKATSTSHQLEEAADALHGHMHHAYGSSYGAHGMEDAATAAHDALHDFGHGEATEAEVLAAVAAANDAFDDMKSQLVANGVILGPNQDMEAKKLYDEVHKKLVKLNAFTN